MGKKKRCKLCGVAILHVNPYCKSCQETDITDFGEYKRGLTSGEIEDWLGLKANTFSTKNLVKRFNKAAGVNTMAIGPQGQSLMYRHDVQRFMERILYGTPTYWD